MMMTLSPLLIKKPATAILFAGFFMLAITYSFEVSAQRKKQNQAEATATAGSDNADSIFTAALQKKLGGEYKEALALFKQFAVLKPNNATAHYEMAKIYYLEEYDVRSALDEAEIASRLEPDNKWIKEFYADMLAISEQKQEANTIYKQLSDKEKLSDDYLIKQLTLHFEQEEYDAALRVLEKMKGSATFDDQEVDLMKYDIFIRQEAFDSAAAIANHLIDADPLQPRYQVMLANVYENRKDTVKALEILNKVAEKFPDDETAQFSLLEYYLSKKDMQNASAVFGKALRNKNISREHRGLLLSVFAVSSMADSSSVHYLKDELRSAATEAPADTFLIRSYAEYLLLSNQRDEAAIQYKRIAGGSEEDKEVWNTLLILYAQENNADSLIRYGTNALQYFPEDVNYQYMTGVGYQIKKEYQPSAKHFEDAVNMMKDSVRYFVSKADMLSSLADSYYFLRSYKQSDSAYEKSLKLDPDNATALNNYSYYLSERGERLEEAEKMSAKSLRLRPNESTFLDTYGWILFKQGKYKDARKYIEQAISTAPDPQNIDGSLYEHLGDIHLKLGNEKEALSNWRKASKMEGASDELAQKIKSLD